MQLPPTSPDRRSEPEPRPDARVIVLLDEDASLIADALQDGLGASFDVVAFPPSDDVIAVLTAAAPRVVAAHRNLHPTVGLVVTGTGSEPATVVATLDAGADDCLPVTDPRELAARVMAIARRRAIAAGRRPPRAVATVGPGT